MPEGSRPEKRRRPGLEAAVCVLAALALLGAWLGPKVYRSVKLAGFIRKLRAAEGDPAKAAPPLHRILGMECAEGEAFLAGYAAESERRAWMPQSRTFFLAAGPGPRGPAEPPEVRAGADGQGILAVRRKGRTREEFHAWCPPCLSVEAMRAAGLDLELDFRLTPAAARAWSVPAEKLWTARLAGKESRELDWAFPRRSYKVRRKGQGFGPAGGGYMTSSHPFGLAKQWIRRAGGEPRRRPGR